MHLTQGVAFHDKRLFVYMIVSFITRTITACILPRIEQLDSDVAEFGISQAIRDLLKRSRIRYRISQLDPDVERLLSNERVVVICNHDRDIEPILLLASLPKRDFLRLIVNKVYLGLVPGLDRYLIPVNINHTFTPKGLVHRIQESRYGVEISHNPPIGERRKYNDVNMKKASEMIDAGSMVIIFPFPWWAPQGSWFTGVGHLIHQTSTSESIYVLNADVKGTSKYDWLRFVPLVSWLFSPLTISFGMPYRVNDIRDLDGKIITRILQDRYDEWSRQLSAKSL